VDEIGITIKRKRRRVAGRIEKLREKREIYREAMRLKREGLKRMQIWEKIGRQVPLNTLEGWIYRDRTPYMLENLKNQIDNHKSKRDSALRACPCL